ncbi:TPA: hypothetical protein ACLIVI_005305 [Bacillus pacificus]|uniref:hypothetical protein n=1 Tax=Bacillus cereus group TaxID=86661 RepID=UPI001964F6F9|nr:MULTISPECIES: hypothetical protein [Bacillus cereus group]MCC2341756.1 hypothetical protein [Bacillus tropicus]MCC2495059.1 hypothetical protein [Bacillus cereus]MCQ6524965.1 hypothetical protein [Bacillus paranthracis]MCU5562089.1 hypothetical protein [Bacillus pacificus]MDX5880453.1 hypothetical protein [Bacillus cereus group sp. BfR-BA-01042]
MKHELGKQKPYHSLTLEKVLEGKKIKMKVSINYSLVVFVGTGDGYSETAYFEIENGQEYIRLNNILYIDDVLIDKVPITKEEKETLQHFVADTLERYEDIKVERFQPEGAMLKFSFDIVRQKFEGHEEYPWFVRERIGFLERNELYPFVYMEEWGDGKILHMIHISYETLKDMTETRLQEKMDSYELRKVEKENT